MARAIFEGKVMGTTVRKYKDRDGVERITHLLHIYQDGEKNLTEIQGVDPNSVSEGQMVSIPCMVYSWATTKGAHGLNIKALLD